MKATLHIDLKKIKENADFLVRMCNKYSISLSFVTKCVCADEKIVALLANTDCSFLADSRVENIASYPKHKQQTMLLRSCDLTELEQAVCCCDIFCVSSLQLLPHLDKLSATKYAKTNAKTKVLLLIDCGDLREGIFYTDTKQIEQFCHTLNGCKNLSLAGIGTNLTCYGGILPDQSNMDILLQSAKIVESICHQKCQIVSGGNSSSICFLQSGKMPKQINNLRIGEALFLGRETAFGNIIEGMHDDCITLSANIIEMFEKPSYPIGTIAMNAFGERQTYQDKGQMCRAICAIGRQDTDVGGLVPCDNNISVVGASSDHLIVDLTKAQNYHFGDSIHFKLSYKALLDCFTSKYVNRVYYN